LIGACRRVNFDFARYRRPEEYGLIAQRAGPVDAPVPADADRA
jgi:hypothetical protein